MVPKWNTRNETQSKFPSSNHECSLQPKRIVKSKLEPIDNCLRNQTLHFDKNIENMGLYKNALSIIVMHKIMKTC